MLVHRDPFKLVLYLVQSTVVHPSASQEVTQIVYMLYIRFHSAQILCSSRTHGRRVEVGSWLHISSSLHNVDVPIFL